MIKSINPATLEVIGEIEENTIEEIQNGFKRARFAQKEWKMIPIKERIKKISQIKKYIVEHFDELSSIISQEVGKPPGEAFVSEVYGAIDSTFYYESNAEEILGTVEEIPLGFYNSMEKSSYLVYKPKGVVAVIGPYNYPFIIPFEQIVQSLMAGNAVIFKPSSDTIFTGKAIQDIFNSIDLPEGLIQTYYGSGSKVGNILIDEADLVVFTGSTETGKKIMKRAADTLTPVDLELGGKSAMIVFPDADIERAVRAARWGVFTNSGQVCASVKRLYLHEDIYDAFLDRLVELTKILKQGLPTEPNVDVGAMINEEQLKIVEKMVEIGRKEGINVLIGGRRNPNYKGYFYEPTILADATNDMKVVQQEIFGPVLVVLKFSDENEVIDLVNNNKYGLTSSVWTSDIEKGKKIAEQIDTGSMMVNEVVYTFALAATPWGGNKDSGIGRTHGKLGFLSVVNPLHVNVDEYQEPDPWWMPYDKNFNEIVENFKVIAESLAKPMKD